MFPDCSGHLYDFSRTFAACKTERSPACHGSPKWHRFAAETTHPLLSNTALRGCPLNIFKMHSGFGRLAQLVARFLHTEEVISSSLVSPTIEKARSTLKNVARAFRFPVHSGDRKGTKFRCVVLCDDAQTHRNPCVHYPRATTNRASRSPASLCTPMAAMSSLSSIASSGMSLRRRIMGAVIQKLAGRWSSEPPSPGATRRVGEGRRGHRSRQPSGPRRWCPGS